MAKAKLPPKPKAPSKAAFKAAHGDSWKADFKAGAALQKQLNAAQKKLKKGTPEYAAAHQAFQDAYAAIYHEPHKSSGFGKLLKKASVLVTPVLPGKKGLQLTGAAKGILGSKASGLVDKALMAGGGIAIGGAAADVASGFLGSGGAIGPQVEGQAMDEQNGGFLDDLFGGLGKAGKYAQGFGEQLAQLKQTFGSGGGDSGGGGPSSDMGPMAPAAPAGFDWKRYAPWIAGAGLLVLVLVLVMRRK